MSASSKKKLRNEQAAKKMTEKQLAEQKEAKKLKVYTAAFAIVMAVIVVAAAWFGISQAISNSGLMERKTVAVTVGDHEITNAELNYFYIDSINNFYNNYGSYASLFGLDLTKSLDEQVTNEETGATWADDFIDSAIENARSVYALADAAEAAGYTLSEDEQASVDSYVNSTMALYALYKGYSDAETYIKALYGKGATQESFHDYYELNTLAKSYYNAYAEDLGYTADDLRAEDAENAALYSVYSYNYYYLNATKFREGGTTDEDGNVTYSDEEKAAAVTACENAAKALTGEEINSVKLLDAAIDALSINADTTASSTAIDDYAYDSVTSVIRDWVTDASRVEGDKTYIASTTTSTNDDGTETETVNGYYVVYFRGSNDNNYPLANVRHILVAYEGGTYDSSTATTTYTDEEKAAAWETATELLNEWKAGEATEESFAALANEKSADSDGTDGGLYTDVYPGQMVTNFNDWCFAEGRTYGDTGLVQSEYGYHIMFYAGDSETLYRDYLITESLRSSDVDSWYNDLLDAMTATEKNTKYISKDLVLSSAS